MGLEAISWAALSPPETTGLMERWGHQRAVRVPWLAARLERAGLALSFDAHGVGAVGRWSRQWFAAPDGVDDQPPVVWLERRSGARVPYTEDAAVVADAVGGFVESVLWARAPDACRLFTSRTGSDGRATVSGNEPGLGYPGADPLPWQLVRSILAVAVHGTQGHDLRRCLVREYDAALTRLAADRARAVRV